MSWQGVSSWVKRMEGSPEHNSSMERRSDKTSHPHVDTQLGEVKRNLVTPNPSIHQLYFKVCRLIVQQHSYSYVHRLAIVFRFLFQVSFLGSYCITHFTLEHRFIPSLSKHRSLLKLIFSLRTSSFCFFTHTLHKRNGSLKLHAFCHNNCFTPLSNFSYRV